MHRARTVLVLVRAQSSRPAGELLSGIAREVAGADGAVVVVRTCGQAAGADGPDTRMPLPPLTAPVAWDRCVGVICLPGAADAAQLDRIRAYGLPVVLAGGSVPGIDAPVVLPGDDDAARTAVDHLVAHGAGRIVLVDDLGTSRGVDREVGFRAALARHGVADRDVVVVDAPVDTQEDGSRAAAAVLAARPSAVVVGSDLAAHGLLATLARQGVSVPGDLAVVGFGDVPGSAFSTPSLTSVSPRGEEVGALAAQLLLRAAAVGDVPAGTHRPPRPTVLGRGSCGCTADLLGEQHRPVRGTATSANALRSELRALLRSTLEAGHDQRDPSTEADVRHAEAEVDALLDGEDLGTALQMRTVLTALHRVTLDPEQLHDVTELVCEYVERCIAEREVEGPADGRPTPRAARISGALWQMRAGIYLHRHERLQTAMREQFAVAFTLLDPSAPDPRTLSWLAGTRVRAGVLGLWRGTAATGLLRIAGAYDPADELGVAVGTTTRVQAFPPPELVALADPSAGEACFVAPIRGSTGDWGLLALVGQIDSSSSRDAFHHWATLLRSAFEAEALERAVDISERRYAHVARAANDGLWQWDRGTDAVYVSDRCREILGLAHGGLLPTQIIGEVFDDRDADAMGRVLAHARRHPDEPGEVECRVRRPDGTTAWVLVRIMGVDLGSGNVDQLVGSISDIDARKALEENLRVAALVDPVTQLPNRRLFHERLGWAIDRARRSPSVGFAVAFFDLDGFKLVNDSLGHLVGDRLLALVGERLRDAVRSTDLAARFGGDEFAVLLDEPEPADLLSIVHRIQDAIAAPMELAGHEVSLTASVGVAISGSGYEVAEDVLRDADLAMYHAKQQARGSAALFDPEMHRRATARLAARSEIGGALADGQVEVHYQPIVSLDGRPVNHLEALVRWRHPRHGLLLPGRFLPDLEGTTSIVALGGWVLDTVCRDIAAWRRDRPEPVQVAVNVSHHEFWCGRLLGTVERALAAHGLPGECLVLEITESVVMTDVVAAQQLMCALRRLGVQLHVDDFGTGYSSLQALRTFPVDALKIDGSFVRELGSVEQSTELVRVIVAMGRALGLDVIAECVETEGQLALLTEMGATSAQGFLLGAAQPWDVAQRVLGLDPCAVRARPGALI